MYYLIDESISSGKLRLFRKRIHRVPLKDIIIYNISGFIPKPPISLFSSANKNVDASTIEREAGFVRNEFFHNYGRIIYLAEWTLKIVVLQA